MRRVPQVRLVQTVFVRWMQQAICSNWEERRAGAGAGAGSSDDSSEGSFHGPASMQPRPWVRRGTDADDEVMDENLYFDDEEEEEEEKEKEEEEDDAARREQRRR